MITIWKYPHITSSKSHASGPQHSHLNLRISPNITRQALVPYSSLSLLISPSHFPIPSMPTTPTLSHPSVLSPNPSHALPSPLHFATFPESAMKIVVLRRVVNLIYHVLQYAGTNSCEPGCWRCRGITRLTIRKSITIKRFGMMFCC
jgi:hypothetical protein